MQLSRAHPRLAHAQLLDLLNDNLGVLHALGMSAAPLVIRLATHAHVLASPAHAQPLDEGLVEDLPEGFFTMRTP